jgi:DNA-binding CsgD family transcriptional regulator
MMSPSIGGGKVVLADDVNDGVVILDSSFRSVAIDAGAEAIFSSLVEKRQDDENLPQEILSLLQSGKNGDGGPMFLSACGHQYSCRPFLVKPRDGSEPMLMLYLRREISIRDAAHEIAVEFHLTEREEEALIGIAMGFSSKELASRMKISPNTVKAFVRLAMIKMGAKTRATIFAKLLDRQSGCQVLTLGGRSAEE